MMGVRFRCVLWVDWGTKVAKCMGKSWCAVSTVICSIYVGGGESAVHSGGAAATKYP